MLLFDNQIHSYIQESLNQCHEQRVVIYYYILNLSIVFLFITFGAVYFYYALTNKVSPEEIHTRNVREKEYVMNQIHRYKAEQLKIDSLSKLPVMERKRGEEELALRPVLF